MLCHRCDLRVDVNEVFVKRMDLRCASAWMASKAREHGPSGEMTALSASH